MRILCIDFDGVIHSYISGWKGVDVIPDPPVKGAFEWLTMLLDDPRWDPQIYSSRSKEPKGILAMQRWFSSHGFNRMNELQFPTEKPPAYLTIDDRAICFRGTFPSLTEMSSFRPWTSGFINEIFKGIEEDDAASTVSAGVEVEPTPKDERVANKPGSYTHNWEDVGVTFMQSYEPEGYHVEVQDNEGVIVKTFVHLYEWSGYVTPLINEKNAVGLIEYLIGLNKMERREKTIIRGEADGVTE